MYVETKTDFDYDVKEDARALLRSSVVKKDPERLAKAKECIREVKEAISGSCRDIKNFKAESSANHKSNPATIGRLNINK